MINFIPSIAKIEKSDRFLAITKALNDYNIPYVIQTLPHQDALGNIIVSFNKSESNKKIVVSAHYDNAFGTPGANDNAAACSILLNLIIFLKAKGTHQNIEFVFFDLEEKGLIGSKYYLKHNVESLLCVYNLDMCGLGHNIVLSTYNGGETFLVKPFNEDVHIFKTLPLGDATTFYSVGIPTIYIINSTDHDLIWFKERAEFGRQTHNIIPDYLRTMHKQSDTPDICNLSQVEKIYEFVRDCIDFQL